jgi:hypothetical protein
MQNSLHMVETRQLPLYRDLCVGTLYLSPTFETGRLTRRASNFKTQTESTSGRRCLIVSHGRLGKGKVRGEGRQLASTEVSGPCFIFENVRVSAGSDRRRPSSRLASGRKTLHEEKKLMNLTTRSAVAGQAPPPALPGGCFPTWETIHDHRKHHLSVSYQR